jgi:hypothetical protein
MLPQDNASVLFITSLVSQTSRACIIGAGRSSKRLTLLGVAQQDDQLSRGGPQSSNEDQSTDQDDYHSMHRAILSVGNPMSAFGVDFRFGSATVSDLCSQRASGWALATTSLIENQDRSKMASLNRNMAASCQVSKAVADHCMFISTSETTPDKVGASTALTVRANSAT